MRISLTEAASQLRDLVDYAEAGSDIILTRDGDAVARLVAIEPGTLRPPATPEQKRAALEAAREAWRSAPEPDLETDAARSQDFLYDENGMPG